MAIALWLALLAPGANLEPGWHHQYQGQLADREGKIVKRFDLHCVVTAGGIYWTVEEIGSGKWPWSSRFGKWTGPSDTAPALLYQTDDFTAVVDLPSPKFHTAKPLTENASWQSDGRTFRVTKDQQAWQVDSRDAYGISERAIVAGDQPLLQKLKRDLVVGRGDRLELKMERTESARMGEAEIASAIQQYEGLLKTRSNMNRPDRVRDNQWSKSQIATWREQLPTKPAIGLKTVLADASTDVREQGARSNALKKIRADAMGKVVQFQLPSTKLGGDEINSADLRGKVVVLHFWTYQSKPLEEPYGQAGYVDFLSRKLNPEKAKVVGVAVVSPETGVSAASRDARKFSQFMNLGYTVATDDGGLIKAVGDPRPANGKLPLFVVLDRNGKIIHYHVGNYEVDRQDGLKELKEVVEGALD